MNKLTLTTVSFEDCTIGRLTCDDFHCFTLELPWLDNAQNISCIPPGIYEYFVRYSPSKDEYVLQLKNVKDRTYIQIHIGNFTSQIEGCIVVGDGIKDVNNDNIPDVINSEETFKKLMELAGDFGLIEIKRAFT